MNSSAPNHQNMETSFTFSVFQCKCLKMHVLEKQNDRAQVLFHEKVIKIELMIKTQTNIWQWAQKHELNSKGKFVFIPH